MNCLDLEYTLEEIYPACGFKYSLLTKELEGGEYGACTFTVNELKVKFRVGKITPTKTGQFVTLWKRNRDGDTEPHAMSDPIDLFVISARKENSIGQFVFPKSVLAKHGVLSHEDRNGKRGFRIYPPWDQPSNKQATHSQLWQLEYFVDLSLKKPLDIQRVKSLYQQQ